MSIVGRRVEQLDLARRQVPPLATIRGDVTDTGSLRSAVDHFTGVNGAWDVVVACAGGAVPGYLEQLDVDRFRAQVELDYLGTVNTVQAVLPVMLARGRGHLVLVSSLAGLIGVFGYGAYARRSSPSVGWDSPSMRSCASAASRSRSSIRRTSGRRDSSGNRTKPPETVRLSEGIPPVSADRVALAMVRGIERDRLTIIADRQTAMIAWFADLHGPVVRAAMRRTLRR